MKRTVILAVLGSLIVGLAAGYFWGVDGNRSDRLKLTGTVEADEVDLAFEVGGPVRRLLAEEGDRVEKGDTLARLEVTKFRQEVERRVGQLSEAKARLEELTTGFRQEDIEQARARVQRFKAQKTFWTKEYRRIKKLHGEGVTSESELDSAKRQLDVSNANYREARENLRKLRNGYRDEKIQQARSSVEALEAAVAQAREDYEDARLEAPVSGWVLTDSVDTGEVVARGTPVFSLADLNDVWVRAYVSQPDLGRINYGQQVVVKTDSYPGKEFRGRISFISDRAEFTPRSVETQEERVKQVYRIKVSVRNPNQVLKPGMPVDAIVPLEGRSL